MNQGHLAHQEQMPSKNHKKRLDHKKWYDTNSQSQRQSSQVNYQQNVESVKLRTANRKACDQTGKKYNAAATKRLLSENAEYLERNRSTSKINTKRRLEENPEYRDCNRKRATTSKQQHINNNVLYKLESQSRWRAASSCNKAKAAGK